MTAMSIKLLREIKHLRGQLVAIILVIGCGSATFIMSRSMHHSLQLTLQDYYEKERYADVFVTLKRAPQTLDAQLRGIEGISAVETRTMFNVLVDVPDLPEPASATLISLPADRELALNELHMVSGRRVTLGSEHEVIAYAPFAEANQLVPGDTIGAVINGRWKRLVIVGTAISPEYIIVMHPGSLMLDNKRNGVLWMSEDVVQSSYDMRGAFNSVTIGVYPGASVPDVLARVDDVLRPFGSWGATGRDDQSSHRFVTDEIKQLEVTALIIPMIFLGVAIFLLNIALMRLVSTQRTAIAILKAFGYGNTQIALHYIGFSLVAVAGGTIVGMAVGNYLGVGLAGWYMEFYRFPRLVFEMPAGVITGSVLMSMVAAVVGAVSAVRAAVRMPPADAMRPEAPRSFKPGVFERLGTWLRLSPVSAMIVRNIERRWVKSGVAVIMIGLSTAILVLAGFMFDAMDHMIALQWDHGQREDAMVTFMLPLTSSARYDVVHLPGVRHVEPFRTIGVDVLHGRQRYRTFVTTIDSTAVLKRVIDDRGRILRVPDDGLVLTQYLATRLGYAVGDVVTLVVLEGARDTMHVPLVGTVREFLGSQGYMSSTAMAEMLDEQGSISGAYLAIDPSSMPAFKSQIKRTPVVAGSLVRQVALQSFKDVYVQNIWITSTYIVILSCVIAFGVVYNSARIALSERATELASLRILGFTKGEIAVILLGEQIVLTLIGIPFGLVAGFVMCWWITVGVEADIFRIIFVFTTQNAGKAAAVITIVTFLSGLLIRRRLVKLDLIAVLKSRE